jgi:hypothetical protein
MKDSNYSTCRHQRHGVRPLSALPVASAFCLLLARLPISLFAGVLPRPARREVLRHHSSLPAGVPTYRADRSAGRLA